MVIITLLQNCQVFYATTQVHFFSFYNIIDNIYYSRLTLKFLEYYINVFILLELKTRHLKKKLFLIGAEILISVICVCIYI